MGSIPPAHRMPAGIGPACRPARLKFPRGLIASFDIHRPNQTGETSMLSFWGKRTGSDCEGNSRRDFLKVGALGLSGLTLPSLLRLRSAQAAASQPVKDTSVVWLWLGGGPTHI